MRENSAYLTVAPRLVLAPGAVLSLAFGSGPSRVLALDRVDLSLKPGTILGVVGESGSGKSTLGFAVGRLLPDDVRPLTGAVTVAARDVWQLSDAALRELRLSTLRYVFQDPIATLDPTHRIGTHLAEAVTPRAVAARVLAGLAEVSLPNSERVAASWPHELSGGMAQHVTIAMAFIANPQVVVADEATSALDASVRTRILELLRAKAKASGITLTLISHDLWAVRSFCDEVVVMYGGHIVEHGLAARVFAQPAHPCTRALLAATPGHEAPGERLATIPGAVGALRRPSTGCAFALRCPRAAANFRVMMPDLTDRAGHRLACWNPG